MTTAQMLAAIAIAAAATILTRALPFIAFPAGKQTPPYIQYLGRVLPGAVFGLLVVYCLREVDVFTGMHGLPEALGVLVAGSTYLWKRNMLLSIAVSTVLYMLIVNVA